MLEIRPCCEHCGIDLPYNSTEAMICSFECTFCKDCTTKIFGNVCPNCGGGFSARPIRPSHYLEKYFISTKRIHNPKDLNEHRILQEKYQSTPPENR